MAPVEKMVARSTLGKTDATLDSRRLMKMDWAAATDMAPERSWKIAGKKIKQLYNSA